MRRDSQPEVRKACLAAAAAADFWGPTFRGPAATPCLRAEAAARTDVVVVLCTDATCAVPTTLRAHACPLAPLLHAHALSRLLRWSHGGGVGGAAAADAATAAGGRRSVRGDDTSGVLVNYYTRALN
jgi:hypothetical protein